MFVQYSLDVNTPHAIAQGRLAQLGERCVRNAEVGSSILLPSTNLRSHVGEPSFARMCWGASYG